MEDRLPSPRSGSPTVGPRSPYMIQGTGPIQQQKSADEWTEELLSENDEILDTLWKELQEEGLLNESAKDRFRLNSARLISLYRTFYHPFVSAIQNKGKQENRQTGVPILPRSTPPPPPVYQQKIFWHPQTMPTGPIPKDPTQEFRVPERPFRGPTTTRKAADHGSSPSPVTPEKWIGTDYIHYKPDADSDLRHSPSTHNTPRFGLAKNVPRPRAFSWEVDELGRLAEGMREHGDTDLDKVAAVVGTKDKAQIRALLDRTQGLLHQQAALGIQGTSHVSTGGL